MFYVMFCGDSKMSCVLLSVKWEYLSRVQEVKSSFKIKLRFLALHHHLHSAAIVRGLSGPSSSVTPTSYTSSLHLPVLLSASCILSIHLLIYSTSLPCTGPNHLRLTPLTLSSRRPTSTVSLACSFLIPSVLVTPKFNSQHLQLCCL